MRIIKRSDKEHEHELKEVEFVDQQDVKKHLFKSHDVFDNIPIAKFDNDKDKLYITEMADCEVYCTTAIDTAYRRYLQFQETTGMKIMPANHKSIFKEIRNTISHLFFNKINMLSRINRNKKDNYLAKWSLIGSDNDTDIIDEEQPSRSKILSKVTRKLANEEERD